MTLPQLDSTTFRDETEVSLDVRSGRARTRDVRFSRTLPVTLGYSKTDGDQARCPLTRSDKIAQAAVRFPPAPPCDVARHRQGPDGADDLAGGGVDDADVVAVDEQDDGGSVDADVGCGRLAACGGPVVAVGRGLCWKHGAENEADRLLEPLVG